MGRQPQRLLDHAQEPVGVADQVVGLALGDRPGGPRLGGRALGGAGGEEGRPLGQLGGDLGQQDPRVLLATATASAPAGPAPPAARRRRAARRRGRRRSGWARRRRPSPRSATRRPGRGRRGWSPAARTGRPARGPSGTGDLTSSRPSVRAADERPAPVAPVEGELEDPAPVAGPVSGTVAGAAPGPRPASTRHSSRSPRRSAPRSPPAPRSARLGDRLVGPDHRPGSTGLPPGPGLHPVRQHGADLPQPAPPQELLGPLGPRHLTHPGLDGVVVPPHALSPVLVDPTDPIR